MASEYGFELMSTYFLEKRL